MTFFVFLGKAYHAFTDLLEREAGRIVIAFLFLFTGVALHKMGIPKADDIIISGSTLVGRELIGSATKKEGRNE